ncbi:MAG: helix-turn-helix domain-containing protein [Chloroflexi bacterium]|nr:helix-turn-helix domain-containing protein [Chloroflexota bacterium]MBI3339638.1 helix-turn-helix domain-containing protein [Chloroflexota bacterium]
MTEEQSKYITEEMPENTDNGISVKQQKAIAALLSERTAKDAAKKAGIGERTLYNWLNEPAFRAALRTAENEILETATRRLSAGQSHALDALETLMQKAKHESTRHAAAVSWLTMFLKYHDIHDIEERLTALEAAINDNKK